jgi:long-chain fatty acid transport protein
MKKRRSIVAAILSLAMCSQAFALGTGSYSSELISTRSLGEGGTGVAGTQNDPVAAYTNPAAMTALAGTQVTVGMTYANDSPSFTSGLNSNGSPLGSYAQASQGSVSGARATSVVVPNFAATTQLMDGRLALGLAAVTPYGLETHFNGDSPLRYQATDTRLRVVDVTPAAAFKIDDMFSIGAGADYYDVVEGDLEKKINVTALNGSLGGAGGPDANSALTGNGYGWGYHLGTTIKPNEHHQIGIVYHSSVKVALQGYQRITGLTGNSAAVFGGSNWQDDVTAPLYMPQNVQLGYAYMPSDKTQIEVDAAWYDFYSGRQLGVDFQGLSAIQSSILNNPASNPTQFKPRRTINFGLGADHKFSDALALRGGAYYQSSSLPESAFDAAFADLPRYAQTFGGSYKLCDAMSADFAYNAVFFHGRAVNDPAAGGSGYSGNFNSFASLVSASLTYRSAMHF